VTDSQTQSTASLPPLYNTGLVNPSNFNRTPVIAGAAIGGSVVFALLVVGIRLLKRRRRQRRIASTAGAEPFTKGLDDGEGLVQSAQPFAGAEEAMQPALESASGSVRSVSRTSSYVAPSETLPPYEGPQENTPSPVTPTAHIGKAAV
jgi:hypothetical protein